jgi:arylsulfatase A-like enzyme
MYVHNTHNQSLLHVHGATGLQHLGQLDSTAVAAAAAAAAAMSLVFVCNVQQRRMPSGMLGDKMYTGESPDGGEGSIRNHLAVLGPGVPAGAVDDTLLGLADILPTIADMANAKTTQHMPWSGSSFAELLAPGGNASESLQNRVQFTLALSANATHCPQAVQLLTRMLPDLDAKG